MWQILSIHLRGPRSRRLLASGQISSAKSANTVQAFQKNRKSHLNTRAHFLVGSWNSPKHCLPWDVRFTVGSNSYFKVWIITLLLVIHIRQIYMASFAPPPGRCGRDVWDMSQFRLGNKDTECAVSSKA